MWFFFSVIVFCSMVTYLARRAEPFVKKWQEQYDYEESVEAPASAPPNLEPIPADLMQLALQETEEWARTGVIRAMVEMYERCRNWDVVRAAYNAHPTENN